LTIRNSAYAYQRSGIRDSGLEERIL
jgi:hypothetical protein